MAKKPRPVYPGPTRSVSFVWEPMWGATSYKLQVGTVSLGADSYNVNLGTALAGVVALAAGTYYSRVVAYQGTTRLSQTRQQTVVVT